MTSDKLLFLDTESHSVDERWDLEKQEFFRLGQYSWGWDEDAPIILTTDYDEVMSVIREADMTVAYNGHSFDFSVLFGKDSTEALDLAFEHKLFDPMTHASLVLPAPYSYQPRVGKRQFNAASPAKARKWFSLDNLCFQLGLEGKIGDLRAMSKKYGGFCHIPLDDPTFLEYAEQDVKALREFTRELFKRSRVSSELMWREQENAAIDAQCERNGVTVDVAQAYTRIEELRVIKEQHLKMLRENFAFPTTGKAPWASNAGKKAIEQALISYGVNIDDLPRTKKDKQDTLNPSFGGKGLIDVCRDKSEEAQEFAAVVAELWGQRSIAQQALDCMKSDGKVHPSIDALQRSARKSTFKPGMTVITSRGKGAVEKKVYVASKNRKLITFDYAAADTRVIAGYSGDLEFLKQTEPGFDAHEATGRLIYKDTYDTNPSLYRFKAKPVNHGSAYRAGAKTLAKATGESVSRMQQYLDDRRRLYPRLHDWQDQVVREGEIKGYITTHWGRRLVVDKKKAYTQAPAQYGQNGTREIVVDALLEMYRRDKRLIQWLVLQVHDELGFDIPETELHWAVPLIVDCMQTTFHPKNGVSVFFPVEASKPSDNWYLASH